MRRSDVILPSVVSLLLLSGAVAFADDGIQGAQLSGVSSTDAHEPGSSAWDVSHRETLTQGFWGLSDALADYGIEVALGATNVYQTNVRGGLDTHQKSGRFSGSYDLEMAVDLEKLLGIEGWGLFIRGEGGWPDVEGIDESMVGSNFGVNADAIGNRSLDLVEVLLEWNIFDGFLTLRAGKMDLAGVFDTSEYANDETSQFLNGALVNNPTIPFPDYGLGVIVIAHVTDAWYIAAGMGDAEADGRESGFRTAFHGPDYFFYAVETGLLAEGASPRGTLLGNYRLGLWYDPQPKARFGGEREYRDDVGVYASVDQMLFKEQHDPEDGQGLGVFGRYGSADAKRNDLATFWSVGVQYQGLLEGRDRDVLAAGYAQGAFSDVASSFFTTRRERAFELYYTVHLAPWVVISPSVQYVCNPGGEGAVGDAVVMGVRAQIMF